MASSFSEQLFDAINLIASKKVSNLPYDQTIVCTIIDNTNASNGEYTVNDGVSEFVTYSENPDYRVNQRVYVTIPNNDRLNKTHITGEYIEDENGNYQTYISPMNNFVDLTGDLIPADIAATQFSLLANDPQRTFITIWHSPSGKVYRNYTCLGIQGNFRTNFPADTPTIGNYGLAVYFDYTTVDGTAMSKVSYFDCSEMFGNPYNFTTDYLQEKLFDISGMDAITSIQVAFYQSKNFEILAGTPLEYATIPEDNLFVKDIQVRIGELLTKYDNDTVRLICNDDLQYKYNEEPLSRRLYLRWIHKIANGLMVLDQNEDQALDASLITTFEGRTVPNYVVRWYRYNLTNGIHDALAGNFWEQMADDEVPWSKDIIPNDRAQYDRFKVIIEYPNSSALRSYLFTEDEDFAVLLNAAKIAAQAGGINPVVFQDYVRCLVFNVPYPDDVDEDGNPVVIDFYDKWCQNEAVPALYQNTALANLRAYITEQLSQIQYYTSDIVSFENKVQVELENVDLIQGLNILVDVDDGGHHGVYRLYDETNNIINTNESRKIRHMTATYTSIALGIDSLDQAEEILWCFPLDQTMIQLPQEGYEYNTEHGDEYFVVDALDATHDASAAQAQRIAEAERYDVAHGTDWHISQQFTVTQLKEQLAIEINRLSITDYAVYWNRVRELRAYYQILIEIILANEYQDAIRGFAAEKGKWGIIRRTGTEIVNNELGEQLIEVQQDFRIKSYYVDNFTNNNIVCLVKRNNRVYQAVTTLHFASLGTSGTEATFLLTMCDQDGFEVGGLIPGGSVTIRPYLYDYNNKPIAFESQVGYKWYSDPVGKVVIVDGQSQRQEVIEMTQSGNDLILRAREDMELSDAAHAILQAQVEYTISYTNGVADNAETKERTVTLTTYLPIPVRVSTEVTHISGATKIVYNSNGTNPVYYKDAYEVHTRHNVNTSNITWELIGDELDDPTAGRYYPTLSSNNELIATNMYFSNTKPVSIIAYGQIEGLNGEQEIWMQPILILQNRYGSAMMNNWDGSLQIDEENGTILSQMVGAGIKNEDNTFSGVLMGNVALADEKIGNKTGLGMYGFHHGEQAFGLNVDGTAFFGKAGSGRITFDGNKGTIQSYNYQEPHTETVQDEDGNLLDQTSGESLNTRTTVTGSGLKIDLDDSTISAYGKTGSLLINTNKYGQPLFVIRDADFSKSHTGNTLFYVSSNSADPVTGKTYDAKYFLQSANYTGTDPEDLIEDNDDEDAPDDGYATGALFDLENGKLDIHGKAGRVFIHGDGSNDLFQIRGWKKVGTQLIKNTLMNVAPNRYYLQSLDYKANSKGFKMDIASGKIMASDFNIKAGNNVDGMIQFTTTGSPYLSITTGTDYIEETIDGQVVYACYDAIDLEDVDAQFEPYRYWIQNIKTPGYYTVDSYIETLYEYSGADPEFEKQKFYYRYYDETVAEKDRVIIDANMRRVDIMLNDDTWNFADTLLPDAPRLYQRLPNPIVLDDRYYFTAGRQYYADAEGLQPVTLYDNASYYKFKELRDAGTLYKQNITPQRDDGTIGFQANRIYYTVDDETKPEIDRKYTPVHMIVDSHDNYDIWEPNKYYYKTVLGAYARSASGFVEHQDYFEAKDPATNSLTPREVLNLTDEAFKPVAKPLVSPNTYFYDSKEQVLWFYNDDWEQVQPTEEWSANVRYGLKRTDTDGGIRAISNVLDNEQLLYVANKWYYEKQEEKYEALDTWQGEDFNYYYKWGELYIKCKRVIECETDLMRIFEPNKYYRYIANKKFLLATDFYSGQHYYNVTNVDELEALDLTTEAGQTALASFEILLCDLNSFPYKDIAIDGIIKTFSRVEGTSENIRGELYWLQADGSYKQVTKTLNSQNEYIPEAFSASREYFIRYQVGTRTSNGTNSLEGLEGIHSVKLVNITKNRFELKSHNWNGIDTGMYFFLNSNSYADVEEDMGEEDSNTGLVPPDTDLDEGVNYVPEPTAISGEKRKVGGGYITGYGFYTTKLLDGTIVYNYPIFKLDWRAGYNRAPIDVNSGAFKVYWNGKVHISNLDAERGRIGAFYLNEQGLFSFNPDRVTGTDEYAKIGLGLLPQGLTDDGSGETSPTTENPKALRILLGTFTTNGVEIAPGISQQGEATQVTETYYEENENGELVAHQRIITVQPSISYQPSTYSFSVNKYGYMRAYGAYLDTATLTRCSIDAANITTGYIGGFHLTDNQLVGSNTTISPSGITTNHLEASGGHIGGWTINSNSLTNGSASLSATKLKIGNAYLTTNSFHVGETYIQSDIAKFDGTVSINGKTTIEGETQITETTIIDGDTTITGITTITGNTTIDGITQLLHDTTIGGFLTVNSMLQGASAQFSGNVTLTDETGWTGKLKAPFIEANVLTTTQSYALAGGGSLSNCSSIDGSNLAIYNCSLLAGGDNFRITNCSSLTGDNLSITGTSSLKLNNTEFTKDGLSELLGLKALAYEDSVGISLEVSGSKEISITYTIPAHHEYGGQETWSFVDNDGSEHSVTYDIYNSVPAEEVTTTITVSIDDANYSEDFGPNGSQPWKIDISDNITYD